jgi:hypothetical protein
MTHSIDLDRLGAGLTLHGSLEGRSRQVSSNETFFPPGGVFRPGLPANELEAATDGADVVLRPVEALSRRPAVLRQPVSARAPGCGVKERRYRAVGESEAPTGQAEARQAPGRVHEYADRGDGMGFRVKKRNVRQGESGFSDSNGPVFRRKDARYPTGVGFVNTTWTTREWGPGVLLGASSRISSTSSRRTGRTISASSALA